MITILGVGHVFDIAKQVRHIILQSDSKAVCIELDPVRYHALRNPDKEKAKTGLTYDMMASFQSKIAEDYGGEAGDEMIAAVDTATEMGIAFCLIDVDARSLFDRILKEMTFGEKAKLFFSSFAALFVRKKTIEEELSSYEDNTELYMATMGKQFPTMKRILVDERNEIMSKNIIKAADMYGDVAVVIGDGHVDGILKILGDRETKVFRLKDIRNMEFPESDVKLEQDNLTLKYSFEQKIE
ncbi:hypothetical protein A3206_08830 [Candidatus Methanomassiliicoccus intestinalis]|uniref:Pheromone shutdown-like protein (TraB) n=1 Tax=Methanomassiliicoccus intestinalis (strain Issoire-Mx1) TaxID=1295009 RepID=R9T464_METII|nr:TraB/GumN family protein [Candidatus Methanomassiliicoccus intestinalis]AGN25530.1 pheromone shutdown -like protein (traB) [Candidatus Methanomassiliicoccus intestinalis Issoire-Mx1]TQS81907.1 MAG: hypothetical protein A3206_08830 [Candidatus Methanomassiliicoccus intestinalis]